MRGFWLYNYETFFASPYLHGCPRFLQNFPVQAIIFLYDLSDYLDHGGEECHARVL